MSNSITSAESSPAAWHWPGRVPSSLGALQAASFIEWRYYAVLSPAFHGIVGLALVNPRQRLGVVAEGGLLLIVAGVLNRPTLPLSTETAGPVAGAAELPAKLCWMHVFPTAACTFDAHAPGSLTARDAECCIALSHQGPAAEIEIEAGAGLSLKLDHVGLAGAAIPPESARDFGGPLGSGGFGAHWTVDCPSPIALADGTLTLGKALLTPLAEGPGGQSSYATPALRTLVATGQGAWTWRGAAGYYEHSYGVRPLPLHGWDFLFVPDAQASQGVVMQTYRGSQALRYVDVCWRQDGRLRRQRFGAGALRLDWAEQTLDPVLGVRRPILRRIEAEADGLRLSLHNRVLHRVPLLRRSKVAVRHFFIDEEIGVADWRLSGADGQELAAARGQPCGGELAHFRLRAPRRD